MKKISVILLMILIFSGTAFAASFNIDENKDVDLQGIHKIIFDLKKPNCAICISTGGQTYSFTGGGNSGKMNLSLDGDLKSNNKKAVPSLMTEANGEVLTIRLYKDTGLFIGLIQNGSTHFSAVLPKYFDGDIEILTSSGDSSVTGINSETILVKSSSGDIDAAELEANSINIVSSSGDTTAVNLSAVESINIDSSSGDVQLDKLLSETASVKASSGRIVIGSLRVTDDVTVHASSGRISAEYLEGGNVLVDASSGKITINELQAQTAGVNTSSGEIKIMQLSSGNTDIKCSSGSTELGIVNLKGDINIISSSGDVDLNIPVRTGFNVDLSASSGKIKSSFKILGEIDSNRKKEVVGEVNGGGHTINVTASSGDISIKESN